MKRSCLLFFICYTWALSAQTSTYFPFPNSDASWYMYQWVYGGHPNVYFEQNFRFYLNGDTTINSNNFHKIYTDVRRVYRDYNNGYTYTSHNYTTPIAAIREQDKRIYITYFNQALNMFPTYSFSPINQAEHVVYDFNLAIGDSILVGNTTYKFIGKDSVLINSNYRTQYNYKISPFQWDSTHTVIEGIGSNVSLFMDLFREKGNGPFIQYLTCYEQAAYNYHFTNEECYNVPLAIDESAYEDNIIAAYPNPANSTINLTIDIPNIIGSYSLYSYTGQLVESKNISSQSTPVSVNNLSKGMYLLSVNLDGVNKPYNKIIIVE